MIAPEKQHPVAVGRARDDEPDRRAEDAHGQHGLPSHAIRETPQQRGAHQLEQRVDAKNQADLERRGVELRSLRIDGEDGNDDPETDHIDEDREKNQTEG